MANLDIIYRIAADISGLKGSVDQGAATMGRMESLATKLGGALAGAFTVREIGQFVNQTIQAADRIQRLSDQTGIGADALQKLEFAATQSGNSLDQVTQAIGQMQNRLASGDSSAVAALDRMQLSLSQLRGLSPDQQFIAIADAVGRIEDPAQRVQLAMDLFGRTGAQILPTLTADVRKLADEFTGMSERSIKVLDQLGDTLEKWARQAKVAGGEFLSAILDPVNAHEEAVQRMARASGNLPPLIRQEELDRLKQTPPELRKVTLSVTEERAAIERLDTEFKKLQASQEKARQTQERWNESVTKATEAAGLSRFMLDNLRQVVIPDLTGRAEEFRTEMEGWTEELDSHLIFALNRTNIGLFTMNTVAQGLPEHIGAVTESTKTLGTHLMELFENVPRKMGEIQETLAGQLTRFFGGGGVMHSIMSSGLNLIFGPASGLLVSLAMQGIAAMSRVIWDGLQTLGGWFADFFRWAWDGIRSIFAGAGVETGPDTTGPPPPGEPGIPGGPHGPEPPQVPLPPNQESLLAGLGSLQVAGGGGGSMVIHSHLFLDGRQVAQSVQRVQGNDLRERNTLRAG